MSSWQRIIVKPVILVIVPVVPLKVIVVASDVPTFKPLIIDVIIVITLKLFITRL